MNENILIPYLLMDRSYELTNNLFINNPDNILNTPGYKYYTTPYRKQQSKYFREIFNIGDGALILRLMDHFEEYIQSDITNLQVSIFDFLFKSIPYLEIAKIKIIADLHCNISLIKICKEFHKKYIGKSSNILSDLYAYNQNILKHLQKDIKNVIDLNSDTQIQTNKNNLINKCLKFKIDYEQL